MARFELKPAAVEALERGARDSAPISGLTHQFYRYPARFSPAFARAAIEAFTDPGDLVVDPFVGGGTTLVEAAVLGRLGVGADISSLAKFVTDIKVTPLTPGDAQALRLWLAAILATDAGATDPAVAATNLRGSDTWRLRRLLAYAIETSAALRPSRRQRFARGVLLKTAQWALDGRRTIPSLRQFRAQLQLDLDGMLDGIDRMRRELRSVRTSARSRWTWCVTTPAAELHRHPIWDSMPKPKLILTSPPYAGVHVLYHRWQVLGRRETSAPFWIAGSHDGHFGSHYTFGDRKNETDYFTAVEEAFRGLAQLASAHTLLVQLVGFSNRQRQLPRYLDVLRSCGFREVGGSRRVWRQVPNRKWHADQKGATPASEEVVLVHRLSQR